MPRKKKPQRRENGEGNIRTRSDGREEFRYTLNNPITGEAERKSLTRKKNESDDEYYGKVEQIKEQIRKEQITDPRKINVWDWIHTFLYSYKQNKVEGTTFDSYEAEAEKHIKNSFIAPIALWDLTTENLQNFYNLLLKDMDKRILKCEKCSHEITDKEQVDKLTQKQARYRHCPKCFLGRLKIEKGISIRTIHYLRTQIIGAALEKACHTTPPKRHGNPNEGTEIPKLTYKKTDPLTREQAKHLLKVNRDDEYYEALYFDAKTGIRIGELCALKWPQIDFDGKQARIKETVKRLKNRDRKSADEKKWKLVDGKPKTEASDDFVPLSNNLIKLLKQLRAKQDLQKRILKKKYQDNGLVFCQPDGSRIKPDNLRKHFKVMLKRAGLPETKFHAMRHTAGSLLLEDGEDLKVIQKLLRHKELSTTADIYVEVTNRLKEKAASRMDNILDVDDDEEARDAK